MTCRPAPGGVVFLLAFSFVQLFPAISPPICPPPCPPPAAVVCRRGDLTAAGGGFFCFFKRGTMWPSSPFCIPQRDFPARRGYVQILAGQILLLCPWGECAHESSCTSCNLLGRVSRSRNSRQDKDIRLVGGGAGEALSASGAFPTPTEPAGETSPPWGIQRGTTPFET